MESGKVTWDTKSLNEDKRVQSSPLPWIRINSINNDGDNFIVEFREKGISSEPEMYNVERRKNESGACYVATCVYGSYDCPEVWALRRFRDYTLDLTWYGRLFIKCYYAVSPVIVKWFGQTMLAAGEISHPQTNQNDQLGTG